MAISNQNRHLIVISGNQSDCLILAKKLTINLDCLLLEEQKKAHTFLGQEFDAVIFDCHASDLNKNFDPNAFGAIAGTIRGGGYLLLLKPENPISDSLFLKRFWSIVAETDHQFIDVALDTNAPELITLNKPQSIKQASKDQNKAVDRIIHVVKGHRRRPLVITADRGRGKSASLGIAAAKLFDVGYENIIVCAPSKKTAAIVFKHTKENSPECDLAFYAPDELQQQKPKADLVLIDEAAAIPVSMLTDFLKHYSRIVFASTQHGYEGSGRGFAINFKKVLNQVAPEWVNCELSTPIRWGENDTLERFVFEALLLNAEPADVHNIKPADCEISKLDKAELINNPAKLSQLFGLLVSAHYQTKPSDLMHMLDDEAVSIHVTQADQKIVAVALLIKEGGIDSKTATDIFEGTRRLQGDLVAQSLAANVGIKTAPSLTGERVIRIAVHPDLQQQGFGSKLLLSLKKQSRADYLSTSFGVTTELLDFWQKHAFTPVYLGMKCDASSGTHSVVMLYAKNSAGQNLLDEAQQIFSKSFSHLLSEPFRNLEADLALALLSPLSTKESLMGDTKQLTAFAEKQRGYENTFYPIWTLVCGELSQASALRREEKEILVLKVLQKHSWQSVSKKTGAKIQGKKDALQLLRQAVSKLLSGR